ncbi:cuticle protein 2-like [Cimex lectularius]|uniref:CPR type cuticle protein n=1 Tax=Cimex lectularius TaxID=79782 RepID=A0A8I6RNC0_CIMLE|nr:cuticle protein 2-like [Cimex lectularius]
MLFKFVLFCLVGVAVGQGEDFDYGGGSGYRKPPPAILMHKQALTQDGAFNFVFAAENGLKQGETIAPDGTRTGAYSYVDPSGQTVSVKYSAGKDGFKIIEGSHVPKTPPHVVQQQREALQASYRSPPPSPPPQQHSPLRSPFSQQDYDGSPSLSNYRSSRPQHQATPVHEYTPGPEDEHKGPHSFGKGYSFEFAG